MNSAGPKDPSTWNRYAYAGGDPINRIDPAGQDWCDASEEWWDCLVEQNSDPLGIESGIMMAGVIVAAAIAEEFAEAASGKSEEDPAPTCADTIPLADRAYDDAVLFVLNENSFNDRRGNPPIMQNLSMEDALLASILNNRAHDQRFASGGNTMNSQAAAAPGHDRGLGGLVNGADLTGLFCTSL
jgi:hypothetical protein